MTPRPVTVAVLAKWPRPGAVKTRLCPPCDQIQAAELAMAALLDTLDAVEAAAVARRVLVLDGGPPRCAPAGFEVLQQRGDGLDERLAAAFTDLGGPTILVGMDTPQVTARMIDASADALLRPGVDAVLGPALDGGYWLVGLRDPNVDVFTGVPMSRADTCAQQLARLRAARRRVSELHVLRDVDDIDDARAVARLAPSSRFARTLAGLPTAHVPA